MRMTAEILEQANEILRDLLDRYKEDFNEIYLTIYNLGTKLGLAESKVHEYDLDLNNPPSIGKLEQKQLLINDCDGDPILIAKTVFNMWYYQILVVAFTFQIAIKVKDKLIAKKLLLQQTQCPFKFNWPQEFIYGLKNHYVGWASMAILPNILINTMDTELKEHSSLELVLLDYLAFVDKLINNKEELLRDIKIRFNVCSDLYRISYTDIVDIKDLAKEVKKQYLNKL